MKRIGAVSKRILDLIIVLPAVILLLPFLPILGMMVFISVGKPLFFTQTRPGLHGRPFRIYKFRTMNDVRGTKGELLPDGERLTSIGRFLRAFSLDELPELLNVLKGEMSIVGPRPLLMQYLDRYTPLQARRHEVKPGLTGWAQVNGRNAVSWEEKFELDVWYVDHQSLWLDLKIICMTVLKVLKREGISHDGEATMVEFDPRVSQTQTD
jgi:sugar transferase EpsL